MPSHVAQGESSSTAHEASYNTEMKTNTNKLLQIMTTTQIDNKNNLGMQQQPASRQLLLSCFNKHLI